MGVEEPIVAMFVRPVVDEEVLEPHPVLKRDMAPVHPLAFGEFGTDEVGE